MDPNYGSARPDFRELALPPGGSTMQAMLGHKPTPATGASSGHSLAEVLTVTDCADTARMPDEQRLVEIVSILAASIRRLWDPQSLPVTTQAQKRGDSATGCPEFSSETVLSVVHGG